MNELELYESTKLQLGGCVTNIIALLRDDYFRHNTRLLQ